jgi:hypothetical protein
MTAPHVVHNVKTGCMECTHCGFQKAIKMPAPIDTILAQFDAFIEAHKGCSAPASETVMSEYIRGFDAGYDYVLCVIERWPEESGQDLSLLLSHLRMEDKKGRETT